jgi:hypothetical protein
MLQYADQDLSLGRLSQPWALHHGPNSHIQLKKKVQNLVLLAFYMKFRGQVALNE